VNASGAMTPQRRVALGIADTTRSLIASLQSKSKNWYAAVFATNSRTRRKTWQHFQTTIAVTQSTQLAQRWRS